MIFTLLGVQIAVMYTFLTAIGKKYEIGSKEHMMWFLVGSMVNFILLEFYRSL